MHNFGRLPEIWRKASSKTLHRKLITRFKVERETQEEETVLERESRLTFHSLTASK